MVSWPFYCHEIIFYLANFLRDKPNWIFSIGSILIWHESFYCLITETMFTGSWQSFIDKLDEISKITINLRIKQNSKIILQKIILLIFTKSYSDPNKIILFENRSVDQVKSIKAFTGHKLWLVALTDESAVWNFLF